MTVLNYLRSIKQVAIDETSLQGKVPYGREGGNTMHMTVEQIVDEAMPPPNITKISKLVWEVDSSSQLCIAVVSPDIGAIGLHMIKVRKHRS